MCGGAIVHCRPGRVVFGVGDPKGGAAGGWINLLQTENLNHRCEVVSGVLEQESRVLLQGFFQEARRKARERALAAAGRVPETGADGCRNGGGELE